MSSHFLNEVLKHSQSFNTTKANESLLFVFDIDSTLYNVSPRNQEIVKDFAHKTEIKEDLRQKLKDFKTHFKDWGIKQALLRMNLGSLDESLINSIKSYWNTHFFSGSFLHHDETYPGAVKYVSQLNKNAPVYYLTGRDIERMGQATLKQLMASGFPVNEIRNKLILKPNKEILDHVYKLEELEKLSKSFSKIYFFENEPVILNEVKKQLNSHVVPVFVDSVHSGRAEISEDIITISPDYSLT